MAKLWKYERIMIVDDEPISVQAIRAMLNMYSIDVKNHVDICTNGLEAVEMFTESINKGIVYNIIFIDFQMPVMDGIEATKKILNQQFHNIDRPIIIGVTGHTHDDYKKQGLRVGMTEVYSKPLYAPQFKKILVKYNIL